VWWVEEGEEGVKKDHLCDLDHFGKLAPPPTAKKRTITLLFHVEKGSKREKEAKT